MRFQVPQFIEKETRIIGPLTLRQFGWFMAMTVVFIFAQFFLSGTVLFMVALVLLGIAAALSFAKVEDVPLPTYIGHAFAFFMSNKKFIFTQKDHGQDYTK